METSSKEKPIIQYTAEGERVEISPYIWGVMHGAPPRYLDDEEEAIRLAKKLGRKVDPSWHPVSTPVTDEELEKADRILREHGIDPDEIDRILQNGGGTLPGWDGKKKTNPGDQTEA